MDGFLIPPFGSIPVIKRNVAEMYTGINNNAYDIGREQDIIIYPTLPIRNDTTVAQTVEFNIDTRESNQTIYNFNNMYLSMDIKIVLANGGTTPGTDFNVSTIDNSLLSLFARANFKINGRMIDTVEDFPSYNHIRNVFTSDEEMRKGVLYEGGTFFDTEGQFNNFKLNVQGKTNNEGYLMRQAKFCTYNGDANPKTWTWNEEGEQMIAPLIMPFMAPLPYGNVYNIQLIYASDSWEHYFLSDSEPKGKLLKPFVSNLHLKIKTYDLTNTSASLEMERKFLSDGFTFHYNSVRTDRFLMVAGNKSYKTIIQNEGNPFMYAFVAVLTTEAVQGNIKSNPFEYRIKGFNANGTNALVSIIASQNQKELSKGFPRRSDAAGAKGARAILVDYWRTAELTKVFAGQPGQVYWDRTFDQFKGGFGVQLFSCCMVLPSVSSPAGRLTAGPVTFEFIFESNTDQNLIAKLVFLNPKSVHLFARKLEGGRNDYKVRMLDEDYYNMLNSKGIAFNHAP